MARNRAQQESVRRLRRLMVTRLYLRGMTMREIRLALAAQNIEKPRPGQVNSKGNPWSLKTIFTDIHRAREDWEKQAAADVGERRRRLVAELREHRREAWRLKQLHEVRLGIIAEGKLDGLEPAQSIDVTSGGEQIPIREVVIYRQREGDAE